MGLYDYAGNPVKIDSSFENIKSNMLLLHEYDSESDTRYTVIRVFKQKTDGTYQYPFVRFVRENGQNKNAKEIRAVEGWHLLFNAGIGEGLIIQNGVVISDTAATTHQGAMPLTIDLNGDLSFVSADTTGKGATMVEQGIVSGACGFFPIVVDYDGYNYPTDIPGTDIESFEHAQRQIFGQFSNGDYALITAEGRGYAGSIGFSISTAQDICMKLGLKFAYNLDGGGSTQTMLDKKSVNTIYDGTGRRMHTWIGFNGSDKFSVPEP